MDFARDDVDVTLFALDGVGVGAGVAPFFRFLAIKRPKPRSLHDDSVVEMEFRSLFSLLFSLSFSCFPVGKSSASQLHPVPGALDQTRAYTYEPGNVMLTLVRMPLMPHLYSPLASKP